MTIFYAMSEISAGLVTVILKRLFSMERPATAFENCPDMVLPVVEGVNLHHSNSFPSGHASTFFVFFTCCAIFLAYHYTQKYRHCNHKPWGLFHASLLLLLVLAVVGAYSRVYLSQHFLSDICMGSFIGFTMPFLVFYFCRHKILKLNNV
jgi:membrane-associated phospholipid phosphatase